MIYFTARTQYRGRVADVDGEIIDDTSVDYYPPMGKPDPTAKYEL